MPFTETDIGANIMRRGRKLLRAGKVTAKQFTLLDTIVWSCRGYRDDQITASYKRLAKLAHQSPDTVRLGLRRLRELKLLRAIKRRVRVIWGSSVASRQATSSYVLLPSTDADSRPVFKGQVVKIKESSCIEGALSALGATAGLQVLT